MTDHEITNLKYDEALEILKDISGQLERKEVSVDDLTGKVKLANKLVDYCRNKLKETEVEIKKIVRPATDD